MYEEVVQDCDFALIFNAVSEMTWINKRIQI